MQEQNIREYAFIREELLSLKDCITKYMGFVLSGSGIAFIGIAAVTKNESSYDIVGNTCFLLSIIITMVLLILMYKFNSHNRFAGYCKLLNQESLRFPEEIKVDDQFMSWEICMDVLRETEFNPKLTLSKCENIEIPDLPKEEIKKKIESYSGPNPEADKNKYIKGFKIILQSLFGKNESHSWHFPTYIVSIFFVLVVIFLFIGGYFIIQAFRAGDISIEPKFIGIIIPVGVTIIQLLVWRIYCRKLYALMDGSTTVDAYCWRFLPIRYDYIKNQNNKIYYNLTTLKK